MRSRRAISSVVGMVFAIIALTSTITYISYSMGVLNNFGQSVLVKNQQLTDVDKEMFQISSVTVPNGKLNVTIADTGNLPINFTKIWIQNTTATDWVHSYVPTNNFVSPGGILTNVGQSIPASINPAYSYNVKLVTSRGNTQQFAVNSISSTKLNVQLAAFPPNVDSGLSSQIVMIVTNNSTGTIVNLTPTASVSPAPPGPPNCALGSASPSMANTLLQGETVVFTWPLTATGTSGQVCTVTAQLPNGQTVQTTVTITQVSLTTATYAMAAGTLTMNYTDFQYTEGTSWNSGWQVPSTNPVAFSLKITNNNVTSDFVISKQTFFWLMDTANGNGVNNQQFYIVNSTNLSTPISLNAYCGGGSGDYCLTISHGGGSAVIYFGASSVGAGGKNTSSLSSQHIYDAFLLFFGKFVNPNTGHTVQYGQNIPFVALYSYP
jgi:hypothetical protein